MIGFAANRNPLQVLKLLEEVDDETRKSKPDAAIPNLPNLRIDAGFRFDDAGDGAVHHGKTQWGCSRWFWGGYSRGCSGCQESRYRLYPEYHFGSRRYISIPKPSGRHLSINRNHDRLRGIRSRCFDIDDEPSRNPEHFPKVGGCGTRSHRER